MMFSVAPTLGKLSKISCPRISPAVQRISPPSSRMSTPNFFRADRCRSMGRGPSSQPPGKLSRALPQRAMMGPRKKTEDRISRIRRMGTSQRVTAEESTVTVLPCRSALQPRCRRISRAKRTSRRSGQLCRVLRPPLSNVAARMGSTLFLAPLTETAPSRGLPPRITKWLMKKLLSGRNLRPFYETCKNLVTGSSGCGKCGRWLRDDPFSGHSLPSLPAGWAGTAARRPFHTGPHRWLPPR